MAKQRLRNRVLNLRPRFAWHSNDLEWAVNILYKSQQRIIASGSGGTYNPLAAEGANVICRQEGRFDPLGCYDNDSEKTYLPVHHDDRRHHVATRHGPPDRPSGRTGRQDGRSRLPRRHRPVRCASVRRSSAKGAASTAWPGT